ncbi:hypothetical protein [Pedobacter gandavensis]|uniref:Uncharacterized protein n=1 Tax=Pedobacter gandavensis TaxID=2679963 RepID=A0ABR6EUI3_9SPHI|nr:hypothetical protein [Pedobacter gandavensis]MBB2148484.1 hypothetical protein [Pedobacter gandavensis]
MKKLIIGLTIVMIALVASSQANIKTVKSKWSNYYIYELKFDGNYHLTNEWPDEAFCYVDKPYYCMIILQYRNGVSFDPIILQYINNPIIYHFNTKGYIVDIE